MGRIKKEEKIVKPKTKPTAPKTPKVRRVEKKLKSDPDMTVKTGLEYSGTVNISLKKDGQIVKSIGTHNMGTILLFQGIANFLIGLYEDNPTATALKPRYLSVGHEDGTLSPTNVLDNRLRNELNVGVRFELYHQLKIDVVSGSIDIIFSANVPGTSVGNSIITEVGLFDSWTVNNPDMLARVRIGQTAADGFTIPVGMTAYIEWTLHIKNAVI